MGSGEAKVKENEHGGSIIISKDNSGKITLCMPYNSYYIKTVKKIPGHRWNPDKKYWWFENINGLLEKLLSAFKSEHIILDSSLKPDPGVSVNKRQQIPTEKKLPEINCLQAPSFKSLRIELVSRKYSTITIKSYMSYNKKFIKFCGKTQKNITVNDVKSFLVYYVEQKKASTSTINSIISALNFYYSTMMGMDFSSKIKRPHKDKQLPIILSEQEVKRICTSTNNIKHKLMMMLVYSAGLRVSEVAKLRIQDLDSDRMLVYINRAKGRKDRYSLLSETVLKALGRYLQEYQPKYWLFEGAGKKRNISIRTVQAVCTNAINKADIKKKASIHSLRHSFATHLMERGISLRYIQELLGHKSSRTTEIYTHVSKSYLCKIQNPLDNLDI
jgi:site-specific recombinase XerD